MKRVRLQHLAAIPITNGLGLPGEHDNPAWPRYIRTTDIETPRTLRADVFASQPPHIAAAAPVKRGDVLASAAGTIGKSVLYLEDAPACYAGFLVRFRANEQTDPRFVSYWMQSAEYWAQIETGAVRSTIDNFSASKYRSLLIPLCPLEEQRRIADFLDDRVARIDKIITARRRQGELVRQEAESLLESLVTQPGAATRPLASLTDPSRPIQYGIVLPGPDFPGGVPIIKGGDIGSGRLQRLELNRTDPEIERAYRRSRVRPGDMVIAIRGSVGEVDVVPVVLDLANLTQDSARIAPFECDDEWLRAALVSPGVQSQMARRITGSTVKGINIAELRRVPIPVPSRAAQTAIARTAKRLREQTAWHVDALGRSIALLTEYRQSLITAAVSGELDVSTAGSGIPG